MLGFDIKMFIARGVIVVALIATIPLIGVILGIVELGVFCAVLRMKRQNKIAAAVKRLRGR